jgi:hypothetical protein
MSQLHVQPHHATMTVHPSVGPEVATFQKVVSTILSFLDS